MSVSVKTAMGWCVGAIAALGLMVFEPASAQDSIPAPGKNYVTDENGIDLISGAMRLSFTEGKIGSLTRTVTPLTLQTEHHRDNFVATIHIADPTWDPTTYTVSFGSFSDTFIPIGTNTWGSSAGETTSILVKSGSLYTFYAETGETVVFDTAYGGNYPVAGNHARATSIKKTNGEYIRIYYKAVTGLPSTSGNSVRIQSVTSSFGYQLKYNYVSNASTTQDWYKIASIVGINNAIE